MAAPKVEIYTTTWCPYCLRAKMLLKKKGVSYIEYNVSGDEAGRAKMTARAQGRYTVPQIFIDDKPIGGCDDLFVLDRQGRLAQLLAG